MNSMSELNLKLELAEAAAGFSIRMKQKIAECRIELATTSDLTRRGQLELAISKLEVAMSASLRVGVFIRRSHQRDIIRADRLKLESSFSISSGRNETSPFPHLWQLMQAIDLGDVQPDIGQIIQSYSLDGEDARQIASYLTEMNPL